jgi:hypothetical protein
MAVIYQEDEDKQENQSSPLAPQNGSVGGTSNALASEVQKTSGAAAEIAPGATPSASASKAAPKSSSSGRFVNIENYLRANPNAKVGQAVAEKVGKQASDADTAIQSAKTQFETKAGAAASNLTLDKSAAEQAEAIAKQQQSVNQQQAKEIASKLAAAQKAEYTGPLDIEGETDLVKKTQDVQKLADLGSTEAGRFELLRSQLGKPTYSTGQQKLDNLFLTRDTGGVEALKNIKDQASSIKGNLDKTKQFAKEFVYGKEGDPTKLGAIKTASDIREKASGLSKAAATTLSNQLSQRAADFNARRAVEQQAVKQDTAFITAQLDALPIDAAAKQVIKRNPELLQELGNRFAEFQGAEARASNIDPELAKAYNEFAAISGMSGLSPEEQVQAGQRLFNTAGAENLFRALPTKPQGLDELGFRIADPNGPIVSNTLQLPDEEVIQYQEALNNAIYTLLNKERPKPQPTSKPIERTLDNFNKDTDVLTWGYI